MIAFAAPPELSPPPSMASLKNGATTSLSLFSFEALYDDKCASELTQPPKCPSCPVKCGGVVQSQASSSPGTMSVQTGTTSLWSSPASSEDGGRSAGFHNGPYSSAPSGRIPPPPPMAPPPPPWTQPAPCDEGNRLWAGLDAAVRRRCRSSTSNGNHAPSAGISFYLSRIRELFDCSDACAVIALVYIDRVARLDPSCAVSEMTWHSVVLTCMVLAAKFHDDDCYSNKHYAAVGFVQTSELATFEKQLVHALDWKLLVGPVEFDCYRDGLISEA